MPRKPRSNTRSRADFMAITAYLQHYVCFECRKTFKKPFTTSDQYLCPQCRLPMTNMGTDFKAPPQKDLKQWRKAEILAREGILFFPSHANNLPGNRPAILKDLPQFLREINPPSESERLLEGPRTKPKAMREGILQAKGSAPHQRFYLLGCELQFGDQLEVFYAGRWQAMFAWGRDGGGSLSRLRSSRGYSELPLEAGLRMRWP